MRQYSGDEHLIFSASPTDFQISDFWRWAFSNLLDNTLRGTYSEFIVATALNLHITDVREEWAAYDLLYPFSWLDENGPHETVRIEIKSSAYLQSWTQNNPSNIKFSIRPTRAWDAHTGYSSDVMRQSDVYIFCLYTATDRNSASPLILDDWDFFVVSTKHLNENCGNQKTLSLSTLKKLSPVQTDYSGLKAAVAQCLH